MLKPLLRLDLLGKAMPSFNIKGEDQVRTKSGGLVSLLIMATIFMFATLKLQHLMNKKSPSITTFTDTSAISNDDTYDVGDDTGFQIAVGLKNYLKGVRNDPRYVKWVVRVYT